MKSLAFKFYWDRIFLVIFSVFAEFVWEFYSEEGKFWSFLIVYWCLGFPSIWVLVELPVVAKQTYGFCWNLLGKLIELFVFQKVGSRATLFVFEMTILYKTFKSFQFSILITSYKRLENHFNDHALDPKEFNIFNVQSSS